MITKVYDPGFDDPVGDLVEGAAYEAITAAEWRAMVPYTWVQIHVVRRSDGTLRLLVHEEVEGYRFEKAA